MKDDETIVIEPKSCMSFAEIQDLSLKCLNYRNGTNYKIHDILNKEMQNEFDQFFNKIFSDSYQVKLPKVKSNPSEQVPIINYNIFKEKMFMADKYAKKLGHDIGTKDYANCFVQCLNKHLIDVYSHSITASGEINGKIKSNPMIVVPNPTQKQKSALSPDIYDLFPDVINSAKKIAKNKEDAEIKVNHLKSFLASGMKSLGENLFNIKDLEYPAKGTNEQLMVVERERYKQLIVFVMLIVGVEAIVSVDPKRLSDLLEKFLPVDNNGEHSWKMLHKTETRQNFVRNIYNILKKGEKMSEGTPKMLAQ
jgi:hypothetical protein